MTTTIHSLLNELTDVPGVRGAATVTEDGIIVASVLSRHVQDDVVAGLASFLVSTTRRSLGESKTFHRLTLHSTNGKFVLYDVGAAFLVTIVDQFAELDPILVVIDDIGEQMRLAARIDA